MPKVNKETLKHMLTYHEQQVKSWEETFKDPKQNGWTWGKDAYAYHQRRCKELLVLFKEADTAKRRK